MSDATAVATPQATPQGATAKAAEGQEANVQKPGQETTPQGSAQPGKAAPAVVPDKYDLKLPEKSVMDAKDLERIASYAKERGLSQQDAQALVERDNATLAAYAERQESQTKATVEAWIETVKADKELGGDNFPKTAELAKRAVERFGNKEFMEALEQTGLGNHPEVVRIFSRIGKAMADDKFVMGGSNAPAQKSIADVLYGGSTKEK